MNTLKTVMGLALFFTLSGIGSTQSLIVNGTFEAAAATPTLGTVVTPPGWTAGTPTDPGRVDVQTYSLYGGGPKPPNTGNQFAAFNDFNSALSPSSISQSFGLTNGVEYDLSFLFGNFNGSAASRTQTLQYSVVSAGALVAQSGTIVRTNSGNTNFSTLLQQFSFLFTAPSTDTYTLTFSVSTPNSGSSDGILDNVFLTRSVPELNGSATLPLALLSVLGCSLWSKRRRTQLASS